MSRRRINNSARRREWRKNRAEELTRLRALYVDAFNMLSKWKWKLIRDFNDLDRQNELFQRLRLRRDRRGIAYHKILDDR